MNIPKESPRFQSGAEGDTNQDEAYHNTGQEFTKPVIKVTKSDSEIISTDMINLGVTGVTGVTANNHAPSRVTPCEISGVTGVTNSPIPTDSPIPSEKDRPCYRVFDDWVEECKPKLKPGVWYFSMKQKGDTPSSPMQDWICSPLHIDALTFDGQDNNFGRLLRFKTSNQKWREWAMPMNLLRGSGEEMRGELLGMGVLIDPSMRCRNLLPAYLQNKTPKRKIKCSLQTGWVGDCFVLPDKVYGENSANIIFQSGECGREEFTCKGTLDDWKSEISGHAINNPMLTLALSAAFAGPLLEKVNTESGGIHFVGDSSTGKTTLIEAACSVWGGSNYKRSWRSTANGMEGAATLFNDGLLALDEISECDPKEIGSIVYALGNGRGKQRASRTGAARGVAKWKCFILSSGERTVATAMLEGGHKAKAGQGLRVLDIPVAGKFGCWDYLGTIGITPFGTLSFGLIPFASGAALSDHIKTVATEQHGHAGRAYLEKLTRDKRDLSEMYEEFKALPCFTAQDGQLKRGAARFALLAMAGELATEHGITGWPEETATKAAAIGYQVWASSRGKGNDEGTQIVNQLTDFIEKHSDSMFSQKGFDRDLKVPIRERAGWWENNNKSERVYLFTNGGLREALHGFDFDRALDHLQSAGILPKSTNGRRAKPHRINDLLIKLYTINTGDEVSQSEVSQGEVSQGANGD